MIATGIDPMEIELAWPVLWPLIERAYRNSDEKPTPAEILARIRRNDLQAWMIYDRNMPVAGICTRLLRELTSGELHCHLWLIAGSRVSDWVPDFLPKLIAWARSEHCAAITGNGRKGWDRLVRQHGGYRTEDRDGKPCFRLDL